MSRALVVFLSLLPLVVLPGNDDPAQLPQAVFLVVGVLMLSALPARRGRPAWSRVATGSRVLLPGATLLAWAACSMLWAHNRYDASQLLVRWGAALLLVIVVSGSVESTADARKLLLALFVASLGVSIAGLLQHLAGWEALPQASPPAGTLGNKNVAAALVAMAMPAGLIALATASERLSWALSGALGVTGAFVFHADSRGAWLALLAQALVGLHLLVSRPAVRRLCSARGAALAFGAGVFVLLALWTPAGAGSERPSRVRLLAATAEPVLRLMTGNAIAPEPDVAERALTPETRAARSVEIRLAVWRNSLAMLRAQPLTGLGLGNFGVHYPRFSVVPDGTRFDQRVEAAHNDYLQLGVELGMVGVVLLAWLGRAMLRHLAAATRDSRADRGMPGMACALGLLAFLVSAAVSPTLSQPAALAALATFVGISAALADGTPLASLVRGSDVRGARSLVSTLRPVAAVLALVVALYWGHAEIRADRHVLALARAEAARDWPAVVREGLRAHRWNPFRPEPLFATASAYLRLGQPAHAAPLLEELIARHPNHVSAVGNLGIARRAVGDDHGAARCFRQVLELRPNHPLARRKLNDILSQGHS